MNRTQPRYIWYTSYIFETGLVKWQEENPTFIIESISQDLTALKNVCGLFVVYKVLTKFEE